MMTSTCFEIFSSISAMSASAKALSTFSFWCFGDRSSFMSALMPFLVTS